MDVYEELEYPSPILKVDKESIEIEAYKHYESSFNIQNIGGSVLKGKLISDNPAIRFENDYFEGNKHEARFYVDLKNLNGLEELNCKIIISSNGGEFIINVAVKPILPFLTTKADFKISNLNELYEFYKKYPVEARFLFSSRDFMYWLNEINYSDMALYEHFIKDPSKERGLDNFFRANNIGNGVFLYFENDKFVLKINPYSKELMPHSIRVNKKGFGYIKTNIKLADNSNWLSLETKDISSSDFESKDFADINFYINPKYIKSDFVKDVILLEGYDKAAKIEVYKKPLINLYLSKTSFEAEDSGFLIVESNYFKDITLEIAASSNFIKFEGKRYLIGAVHTELKFDIKTSALVNAQMSFRRQPVLHSSFIVKAYFEDSVITRELKFNIGNIV
ncbi:MAG: DUF5717 family protein [Clostridiales bacterium]|nr:DUF5717 family protein [Clostridiales bacterium]